MSRWYCLSERCKKYRISVDIDIEKDIPEISAIGNQVQQVLMNLLINARQAMTEGGQLVIKLKKNLQSNTVDLSVRDYGPGISQEKLRKIFDPFYSTKAGRTKREKVEPESDYRLVKISSKRMVERSALKAALEKELALP